MGPWPIMVSHLMCATCQFMDREFCWSNSSRSAFPDTSRSANSFISFNCALVSGLGYNVFRVINTRSVKYPISNVIGYIKLTKKHLPYSLALNANYESKSYNKVEKNFEWCEVMDREIQAFQRNNTSVITDLPYDKKPIGCKWVYKINYKGDGSLEQYKGHLVANGYNQLE